LVSNKKKALFMMKSFHTEDGPLEFPVKKYDGAEVPLGFYYESDIQSRWEQLNKLLTNSVLPIIKRLIDDEISKYFYLDEFSFTAKVYAGPFKKFVDSHSLDGALKMVISEYDYHDSLNDDFFINIEFDSLRIGNSRKQYGCQIHITNGSVGIQDVETEQEFYVWYLYVGGEKTTIDIPFTTDQENKIIGYYLRCLWQSEEDKEFK